MENQGKGKNLKSKTLTIRLREDEFSDIQYVADQYHTSYTNAIVIAIRNEKREISAGAEEGENSMNDIRGLEEAARESNEIAKDKGLKFALYYNPIQNKAWLEEWESWGSVETNVRDGLVFGGIVNAPATVEDLHESIVQSLADAETK